MVIERDGSISISNKDTRLAESCQLALTHIRLGSELRGYSVDEFMRRECKQVTFCPPRKNQSLRLFTVMAESAYLKELYLSYGMGPMAEGRVSNWGSQ
ncbi:MAG: hypothetical protein NZ899_05730 [Thermoguttaceae bacterium]|nr:hypothetical protein [Thermoguttaceae bacterium]